MTKAMLRRIRQKRAHISTIVPWTGEVPPDLGRGFEQQLRSRHCGWAAGRLHCHGRRHCSAPGLVSDTPGGGRNYGAVTQMRSSSVSTTPTRPTAARIACTVPATGATSSMETGGLFLGGGTCPALGRVLACRGERHGRRWRFAPGGVVAAKRCAVRGAAESRTALRRGDHRAGVLS